MANNGGKKINKKRFWYSITPLLLMVLAIVVINLLSANSPQTTENSGADTAVSAQSSPPATTVTRPPILQATILPSPTPTLTPRPNVLDGATITLFGPPAESSLPLNGRIAFYWNYSEPLLSGQELRLTLRQDDQIVATSSLDQPNFGNGYQVVLDMTEAASGGTAVWQVHLQWQDTDQSLLSSERRSLTLLSQ